MPSKIALNFWAHFLRFSGVSLFCWLALMLLLGPVWGWHLKDMGAWIVERSDVLERYGGEAHPALEAFGHTSALTCLKSGALLGFLFLAWPWALWCGLMEAIAMSCRPSSWKKFYVRFAVMAIGILLLGDLVTPFASSLWSQVWCGLILLSSPLIASFCYDVSQKRSRRRHWVLLLVICTGVVSLGTHPVWDLWLRSDRFEGHNKMTLLRDVLILDKRGEHWLNDAYYTHSPLLMERERVTFFQPMLVGTMGIADSWERHLKFGFRSPQAPMHQPMWLFTCFDLEQVTTDLYRGLVDHLVISKQVWDAKALQFSMFPEGSVTVLSEKSLKGSTQKGEFDLRSYYQKETDGHSSPLLRALWKLREKGYREEQSKAILMGKQGLVFLIQHPFSLLSVSLIFLMGLGLWFWRGVMAISETKLGVGLLSLCSILMLVIASLPERLDYWSGGEDSTYRKIIDYHAMAVQPQADDVQAILKAPLPSDARLLMLSVSILGRGWPRLENEQWIKKAEKRLQHILNSYESYPFNIRYKIIDALALEPIWRPKVKHASEQEAHLYVHWYKASLGL